MENEFDYVLPRLDEGDEDDTHIAKYIQQLQAKIERLERLLNWADKSINELGNAYQDAGHETVLMAIDAERAGRPVILETDYISMGKALKPGGLMAKRPMNKKKITRQEVQEYLEHMNIRDLSDMFQELRERNIGFSLVIGYGVAKSVEEENKQKNE